LFYEPDIVKYIIINRLDWAGHVMRMDNSFHSNLICIIPNVRMLGIAPILCSLLVRSGFESRLEDRLSRLRCLVVLLSLSRQTRLHVTTQYIGQSCGFARHCTICKYRLQSTVCLWMALH